MNFRRVHSINITEKTESEIIYVAYGKLFYKEYIKKYLADVIPNATGPSMYLSKCINSYTPTKVRIIKKTPAYNYGLVLDGEFKDKVVFWNEYPIQ